MGMLASELFALACGTRNSGTERCHWCGSACSRLHEHDEPPPVPFTKTVTTARVRSSPYLCLGCYIYRWASVSILFLSGGRTVDTRLKDRQTAVRHSWWITEEGAWAVRPEDHAKLYQLLLRPPRQFVLALKTPLFCRNEIHLAVANDHEGIREDTSLLFTIDHIPYSYTLYELREAIKDSPEGTEPGVQALYRYLGPPPEFLSKEKPSASRKSLRSAKEPTATTSP